MSVILSRFLAVKNVVWMCVAFVWLMPGAWGGEKKMRIVGVHSYAADFPWTRMLIEGFEANLKGEEIAASVYRQAPIAFESRHFYLDEKRLNVAGKEAEAAARVEEVWKGVLSEKPDFVFLTDDYALDRLGVRLAEKKIQFVFAGVNGVVSAELERTSFKGFAGVYERYYLKESMGLLMRLLRKKSVNVLVLLEDTFTGRIVAGQVKEELGALKDVRFEILLTNQFKDWKAAVSSRKEFDAFLPLQPYGLVDESGSPLRGETVISWLAHHSPKPTVYTAHWHIVCGGSLAVTQWPSAQGYYASSQMRGVKNKKLERKFVIPPHGSIELNTKSLENLKVFIPFELLSSARLSRKVPDECIATKEN